MSTVDVDLDPGESPRALLWADLRRPNTYMMLVLLAAWALKFYLVWF